MTSLLWSAEEIVRIVRGESLHEQSWRATGLSANSQTLCPGDLYIALQGPESDGHDAVAAAFAAGACAALVHRRPAQVPFDAPLVYVEDTLEALYLLAAARRATTHARLIALTGSVGKSCCAAMMALALDAAPPAAAFAGPAAWSLPLALASLPQEAAFGLIETKATDRALETVAPDILFVTRTETQADLAAACALMQGMKAHGLVVLPRDDAAFEALHADARAHGIKKIRTFGQHPKSDMRLVDHLPTTGGGFVETLVEGQTLGFSVGASGRHQALNALGSLLTAQSLGADPFSAAESLAAFHAPRGFGAQTILYDAAGDPFTLIDASAGATVASVHALIDVLAAAPKGFGAQRIMALGSLDGLGDAAPLIHAGFAADLVHAGIDCVFCCGPFAESLDEALPFALRGGRAADSAALAVLVRETLSGGDVIAIQGGAAQHMSELVERLKLSPASPPLRRAG